MELAKFTYWNETNSFLNSLFDIIQIGVSTETTFPFLDKTKCSMSRLLEYNVKNLNYGTELHKRHLSHTIVRQINKNMGKGLRKKRQTLLKLIIKRRTFKGILCCY